MTLFCSGCTVPARCGIERDGVVCRRTGAVLRQQYDLRQADYERRYPSMIREVVVRDQKPVGRLWIGRDDDEWRVLDLSFLPGADPGLASTAQVLRLLLPRIRGTDFRSGQRFARKMPPGSASGGVGISPGWRCGARRWVSADGVVRVKEQGREESGRTVSWNDYRGRFNYAPVGWAFCSGQILSIAAEHGVVCIAWHHLRRQWANDLCSSRSARTDPGGQARDQG